MTKVSESLGKIWKSHLFWGDGQLYLRDFDLAAR